MIIKQMIRIGAMKTPFFIKIIFLLVVPLPIVFYLKKIYHLFFMMFFHLSVPLKLETWVL